MANELQYKGYTGTAVFDFERKVAHGRVQLVDDLVTYESPTVEGLEREFRDAVDDYLLTCEQLGRPPKKAFNGIFNVRTAPTKHQQLSALANNTGVSLNALMNTAIDLVLGLPASVPSAREVTTALAAQSTIGPSGKEQSPKYFQNHGPHGSKMRQTRASAPQLRTSHQWLLSSHPGASARSYCVVLQGGKRMSEAAAAAEYAVSTETAAVTSAGTSASGAGSVGAEITIMKVKQH